MKVKESRYGRVTARYQSSWLLDRSRRWINGRETKSTPTELEVAEVPAASLLGISSDYFGRSSSDGRRAIALKPGGVRTTMLIT